MSESEQGRQGGAPADTPDIRRLRVVSAFTDPFLVTKLPQETSVVSGVIRLGERTVLGFLHQPFADGTRVRVVYREWLLAERIESSDSDSLGNANDVATSDGAEASGEEPAGPPAEESQATDSAVTATNQPSSDPVDVESDEAPDEEESAGKPVEDESDTVKVVQEKPSEDPSGALPNDSEPRGKPVPGNTTAEHEQAEPAKNEVRQPSDADASEGKDVFPDDLTGTDDEDAVRSKGDDPWTDAFRRGGKRQGDED